ncbi:MAG: PorT family protein [Muribaculaceae bacterium]|nr:PorT family protein [Muribaculaceae bacterium]
MTILKRIVLVTVMMVLGIGAASADFRFGIKAGMNVNKLHFSKDYKNAAGETLDPANSTGWTAGVTADFTVPIIGIGMDASVMYTRMNNAAKDKIGNQTIDYGKNFIQLPIHLKYKLSLPVVGRIIAPYLFTGPDFSFKLDKKIVDAIKTKSCQVGWDLGLGVELLRHLQVGASYTWDINKIAKWTPIGSDLKPIKIRNNYWTITAAYMF